MSPVPPRIIRSLEPEANTARVLEAVRKALERLRFGTVTLTVHDGSAAQIEITEKRRFDA